MTAISVVLFDLLQHKVREISLSKQIYSHIISGSSRKWSDLTWTHRKQLEQLLQQVTTLSVSHSVTHFPLISPGVMSWRSLVFCCLPGSRRYWQQHKPYHSIFRKNQKNDGGRNPFHPPPRSYDRIDQFVFSTLRRRIGRPPGPPGCGGTSTTDRPWNSRWRKPHPGRRCWHRPVREDRCKYLLSYPLR